MSLHLLLSTIQNAGIGNIPNTILMLINAVIEALSLSDDKHDREVAGLREMIARLEDRNLQALEAYRAEVRREMDVVAESVEHTRDHLLAQLREFTPNPN